MNHNAPTCFECNAPAEHMHHLIPRSRGGQRAVPLCLRCHGLVHDRDFPVDHAVLIREGLQRAAASGTVLGRPRVGVDVEAQVMALRKEGRGIIAIAKQLGLGNGTVQRILAAPATTELSVAPIEGHA